MASVPDVLDYQPPQEKPRRGRWRGPWIGWVVGVLVAALLVWWLLGDVIQDFRRGIVP